MQTSHAADGTRGESFNMKRPTTKLGRIAMRMALAFIVLFAINIPLNVIFGTSTNQTLNDFSRDVLPYYGISMFAVGFASGVVGLVAIVKHKERSLFTLLTVIPLLFVITFLIGEFVFPH